MDVFGTAFLPNTSYLHQLLIAPKAVIDVGEHFVKQTQRNRTYILSSNGPLAIIIPLRKNDSKRVMDQEISYAENWQTKAFRAIRSSYENSPYYEHYLPEFEDVFMQKELLLYTFNQDLLNWLFRQLEAEQTVDYAKEYVEDGIMHDYRNKDFFGIDQHFKVNSYKQVFSHKMSFAPQLSAIDLLFNKGPEAMAYLK